MQFGAPDTPLGPGQAAFSEGSLHPWAPESESRHLVEAGAEPRGMETPCRLEVVQPGRSGLFVSEETHCPLWFFLTHTVLLGLDAIVQTWQRLHSVHSSPDCSAPRTSREDLAPEWTSECDM